MNRTSALGVVTTLCLRADAASLSSFTSKRYQKDLSSWCTAVREHALPIDRACTVHHCTEIPMCYKSNDPCPSLCREGQREVAKLVSLAVASHHSYCIAASRSGRMALGWRAVLFVSLLAVSFCAANEDSREAHISAQHAAKVCLVAVSCAVWASIHAGSLAVHLSLRSLPTRSSCPLAFPVASNLSEYLGSSRRARC